MTGTVDRDALDAVFAVENDGGRPELAAPSIAATMRATPRPDVQVERPPGVERDVRDVPGAQVLVAPPPPAPVVGDTGTPSTVTRSRSGTLASPCSPINPGVDTARRDTQRPCEAGAQPEAVVERVAEDAAPVETRTLL